MDDRPIPVGDHQKESQNDPFAYPHEHDETVVNRGASSIQSSRSFSLQAFWAWRERDHDDLVLATALAVWAGELALPYEGPVGVQRVLIPEVLVR